MFPTVKIMMKAIIVVYVTFFTKVWGKHYLIKTEDEVSHIPYQNEAGGDYSEDPYRPRLYKGPEEPNLTG